MTEHAPLGHLLQGSEPLLLANYLYIVFGFLSLYAIYFYPISPIKIISGLSPTAASPSEAVKHPKDANPRDVANAIVSRCLDGILFFGSQTGTAEDYARRLAKAMKDTFDVSVAVADLDDFDLSTLSNVVELRTPLGRRPLIGFIVATYGDGEPTDNAASFNDFITDDASLYANGIPRSEKPLDGLRYLAFGLGNSTYEQYNLMVRRVSEHLDLLGAARVGDVGEADDGAGTTDENFLDWKSSTFSVLGDVMGFEQSKEVWEPTHAIEEQPHVDMFDQSVDLGHDTIYQPERSKVRAFRAPVQLPKQMYNSIGIEQRECLHLEFDIGGTDLTYTTGDHVGILPPNPDHEVLRSLNILALTDRKDTVISITEQGVMSSSTSHKRSTYAAVLRYQLEICGSVSREAISCLSQYAPSEDARDLLTRLENDRSFFQTFVSHRCLNLAQLLQIASHDQPWTSLPFAALFDVLPPLQPRYYSISSSSIETPKSIHVTVAVKREAAALDRPDFYGVASNYMRSLARAKGATNMSNTHDVAFELNPPRSSKKLLSALIQVRRSQFRLPPEPHVPIVMIGPGTGVAPFRGFVKERVKLSQQGMHVGLSALYFGCRVEQEDLLYPEAWEAATRELKDKFLMRIAFSRQESAKVYVQDRLLEDAERVFDLLDTQGAWLYVCGDAKGMTRDVHTILESIIAARSQSDGKKYLRELKQAGRFHVSPNLSASS
jgi:NADPH-ferrihemoprotein reductase